MVAFNHLATTDQGHLTVRSPFRRGIQPGNDAGSSAPALQPAWQHEHEPARPGCDHSRARAMAEPCGCGRRAAQPLVPSRNRASCGVDQKDMTRMPASLAICVINFQGRDVLQDTLAAVCAQLPRPDEIVLIDNASTDGGLELVRNRFPEVRIIACRRISGPGPARETGLRAVGTDLVASSTTMWCRCRTASSCSQQRCATPAAPPWRCRAWSTPTSRSGSSSRALARTSSG